MYTQALNYRRQALNRTYPPFETCYQVDRPCLESAYGFLQSTAARPGDDINGVSI